MPKYEVRDGKLVGVDTDEKKISVLVAETGEVEDFKGDDRYTGEEWMLRTLGEEIRVILKDGFVFKLSLREE